MALVFTIMLCMLSVSGCWDRREVNDVAFVIAMAIDKASNGKYRLSVQVPLVSNLGGASGGGGGTSGDKAFYVDSAEGDTIRDANNKIQSRMSRHLYYAHHRIVVIGNQLAKEGFSEPLDIISRFPENRLTAYIVMTKGEAVSLLQAQPQFERFSGEAIRELVKAATIPVTIKDISQMLNTPGVDAFLPIFEAVDSHPKGKSKEIGSSGIGIFRGDKLVGTYTGEEVMGLRWFQRTFVPFSTIVNMGDGQRLSVYYQKGKADIHPVIKRGVIHFDIKVYSTAGVVENLSSYDLSERKVDAMIEDQLTKEITRSITKIMEKNKKAHSDPIGLGIVLARNYPNEWKAKYRDQWDKELSRITYTIKSKVQVSNVGQTSTNITKEDP
ncbi:Ger(x)C family spore germination protein [Brevibacillus choshinensis]|uniref:Ger(x)C family spore germination protein n=1 Tax=Brevibacillus choshinensis TaxID=54911 RepID=UPI002E1D1646|nr:Ger(x)C family spore germination protein [Brevibacillus choshinensis]MED4750045.1 Ger(x)C family spore germination protein [Brevibacillus choshinensis]MED4780631.1 Ger(x)C family spore germination protein [Brevibacillus choshinensis]